MSPMASQHDSVDHLSQMPTEILNAIITEATTTVIHVCQNMSHCRSWMLKGDGILQQNPKITLPVINKAFNRAYTVILKHPGITLHFGSEVCAVWHIQNADSCMFADVSNITFKDWISTREYKKLSDGESWEDFKKRKWWAFARKIRHEMVEVDIQCSPKVSPDHAKVAMLVWMIPVS